MSKFNFALAAFGAAAVFATAAPRASAALIEDYDDGVANVFLPTNEITSSSFVTTGIGGLQVNTSGAFKNALSTFVPRDSGLLTDILNNSVFEFARQSLDAGSTGTFINSFVVFQTDANGLNYKVLDNSGQFIDPGSDAVTPYSYNYRTGDPAALAAFTAYRNGAGTFANVFIVQQTNDNVTSSLIYDDIAVSGGVPVPEPTTLSVLGLAAVGLLARRRRA